MTTQTRPATGYLLLIHSDYGDVPPLFESALERGSALVVRERTLSAEHFAGACGLITTMHLDQNGFMDHRDAMQDLLARGGRWFFNGHILRPLLPGLRIYQPIPNAKRADLIMKRLFDHPIFANVEQEDLEETKGVAGFYGRGCNPLPDGAVAVNGLGPDLLPVDWEWVLPSGGRIFSHAGNDLAGMGAANGIDKILMDRIVAWTRGDL